MFCVQNYNFVHFTDLECFPDMIPVFVVFKITFYFLTVKMNFVLLQQRLLLVWLVIVRSYKYPVVTFQRASWLNTEL